MKCCDCGEFFDPDQEGHCCPWCHGILCERCYQEHVIREDIREENEGEEYGLRFS